jgi:hypothetical protein
VPLGDENASRPAAWHVVDSETLLQNRWLSVHRQRLRTASGHEIEEYYTIDAPDIVVALALTEASEAILVRQYRHGVARVVLELPAGMLEAGENPRAAIVRELRKRQGTRSGRSSRWPWSTRAPPASRIARTAISRSAAAR